jgi:hypothetical protein
MRDMQLGLIFRAVQEEAYAAWDAWDKALGGETERESPNLIEDVGAEAIRPRIPDRAKDLVAQWLSRFWEPQWVGQPETAAGGTPQQNHIFYMEVGEIHITCSWGAPVNKTPAYIWMSWRAYIPKPSELWARFIRPETNIMLTEVFLGIHLEGEASFSSDELGFDPSAENEKWAVSIALKDVES